VHNLGAMMHNGRGGPRIVRDAVTYMGLAASMGPWLGHVRRGLDQYLWSRELARPSLADLGSRALDVTVGAADDSQAQRQRVAEWRALANYVLAAEANVVMAKGNAAYLLRRRLSRPSDVDREAGLRLADAFDSGPGDTSPPSTRQSLGSLGAYELTLLQACTEAQQGQTWGSCGGGGDSPAVGDNEAFFSLLIGDVYFKGRGDLPADDVLAQWWYNRASAHGSALGSLYSGAILQFHADSGSAADDVRAIQYYDYAVRQIGGGGDDDDTGLGSGSLGALMATWRVDADAAKGQVAGSVLLFASAFRFLLRNKGSYLISPLAWVARYFWTGEWR
jgi:hypothetical protein